MPNPDTLPTDSFWDIQQDIVQWVHRVMPGVSLPCHLIKLRQEADELFDAHTRAELRDELADVVIVACAAAGFADIDLSEAVMEKMRINKARKWERRINGTYQHVRETKEISLGSAGVSQEEPKSCHSGGEGCGSERLDVVG